MKKRFIAGLLITIIAIGCTKQEDGLAGINKAVVESYLAPGQPVSVKITKEIEYGTDTVNLPLDNLTVVIANNGTDYTLTNAGNGIYNSNTLPVAVGGTYQLKFDYNGVQVSATTVIPGKPANFTQSATTLTVPTTFPPTAIPSPINLKWENPNLDYHLVVVTNLEANPVPINSNGQGRPVFRTEPSQTTSQELSFRQFTYLGNHRVVLYRIWPEYAALYEDNGNNSNNLAEPPTNVVNGRGIFTGINTADTLYVKVQ
jgi:Domain of unknown function (DUF4249)